MSGCCGHDARFDGVSQDYKRGYVSLLFTALGILVTSSAWPDLIVAGIMASLLLSSAPQIIKQSFNERRKIYGFRLQTG